MILIFFFIFCIIFFKLKIFEIRIWFFRFKSFTIIKQTSRDIKLFREIWIFLRCLFLNFFQTSKNDIANFLFIIFINFFFFWSFFVNLIFIFNILFLFLFNLKIFVRFIFFVGDFFFRFSFSAFNFRFFRLNFFSFNFVFNFGRFIFKRFFSI